MKTTPAQNESESAEAILKQSFADRMDDAEIVTKAPDPTKPVSIRLSSALIERLDLLAKVQGRSRSNLIQNVLWAYARQSKVDEKAPEPVGIVVIRAPMNKDKRFTLRTIKK